MTDELSRRGVMAGTGAAALIGATRLAAAEAPAATPVAAPGAGIASGTVREVILDPVAPSDLPPRQGPPIAGVLVSNGRDVVRSDADGRYSLPVAPGESIFVIKPAGFQVPVAAETKLPLFSYVHDPEGTPAALNFRYGGMPPTGPLPAAIDFALTRRPEPACFDVILFTDPQPESSIEIAYVRDAVVAGLVGTQAAFGITCGDIAFDDLAMYGRINRIVGQIGVPWWNIGGNHDLDYEAPDAARSRDTYRRVFGAPFYAHEHGQAMFIMLDNVDYAGAAPDKPGGRGSYRGVIPAEQLAFVRNLLAETPRDRLLVFCMHIPLRTYLDRAPAQNTANLDALLALIGDRPAVSFAGHTHTTEHHYFGAAEGGSDAHPHHHHVLTAVSGSWWSGPKDHRGISCADSYDGSPNGFHVLSINGTGYATRFVPASEPRAKQMRISLDTQYHSSDRDALREIAEVELLGSPIMPEQVAATRVVVNLFDGGPRSEVAMVVDGGAPVPMQRVLKPDPFVVQLYARSPGTIKPWVKPMPCSHLWHATLPAGLAPGAHALRVVARDEYGREVREAMVVEVV